MKEKIDYLKKMLPNIKVINLNKLNKKQNLCINNIYNHYFNNLPVNKSNLRKLFKEERSKFNIKKIKKDSVKLNKKIIRLKEFKTAKVVFCYISFDNETDTYYLLENILKQNKTLCVPVINGNKMIACKIDNISNLKKNKYNILEPIKEIEINKENIDLIIVPALGYNPLGFRIGYGKGFYDNYLKDYNGNTVGMIFNKFISIDLIPDIYDVPIKKIISL